VSLSLPRLCAFLIIPFLQALLEALSSPVKDCTVKEPLRSTILFNINQKLAEARSDPKLVEPRNGWPIPAESFKPTPFQTGPTFFYHFEQAVLQKLRKPYLDPPSQLWEKAFPVLFPAVLLQNMLRGRSFMLDPRTNEITCGPPICKACRTSPSLRSTSNG
jgi:hypothetical protein